MINDIYRNKKVLVTGHTGFKGAWLSLWLSKMGAEVIGLSDSVPTNPSHFVAGGIESIVETHFADIRDAQKVAEIVQSVKPDFVFHMAAQALVKPSYSNPLETVEINAMGTANVLAALGKLDNLCNAVFITSDKCYENVETYYGYREDDRLGGSDPYSASKATAEIIISSFQRSFFASPDPVRLAVARAGNVIGGGDWSEDRLVPDIVKSWDAKEKVVIRRPQATRPWQLVLEPLSGYLQLGAQLSQSTDLHGESFNLGPPADAVFPVRDVVVELKKHLNGLDLTIDESQANFHEAGLLKLCCDKALSVMGWKPVLDFNETLEMTASWYRNFYEKSVPVQQFSEQQLDRYISLAEQRNLPWCR